MSIISDLAALANAGFKASEIMELAKADRESKKVPDPETDKEPDPEPDKEPDPEPDYKSMYEETKKKLDDIQASNTKKELPDDELTIDEIIKNIKAEIS